MTETPIASIGSRPTVVQRLPVDTEATSLSPGFYLIEIDFITDRISLTPENARERLLHFVSRYQTELLSQSPTAAIGWTFHYASVEQIEPMEEIRLREGQVLARANIVFQIRDVGQFAVGPLGIVKIILTAIGIALGAFVVYHVVRTTIYSITVVLRGVERGMERVATGISYAIPIGLAILAILGIAYLWKRR